MIDFPYFTVPGMVMVFEQRHAVLCSEPIADCTTFLVRVKLYLDIN